MLEDVEDKRKTRYKQLTMNMKHFLLILLILGFGCSSPTPTDTVAVIDIAKALKNPCDIFLSDFVDEIEYISLETLSESVNNEGLCVYTTDNYIVAISFRLNHLFDRKTGRFIRKIGRRGQGPNDYLATLSRYGFDENRQTIQCVGNKMNRVEYDLDGNVFRKFYAEEIVAAKDFIALDENSFVWYQENYSGNEPYKLFLFDDKGNVFNKFPNYHSYIPDPFSYSTMPCIFYKWKNNVFFYENLVDTLFQITKDELIPYYRFDLEKFNPPYSERAKLDFPNEKPMMNKYVFFQTINESDRFLFFSFRHDKTDQERRLISRYFGFHDKKTGITKISEVDKTDRSPVINDIDGFAPLYPLLMSINQSGELIAYYEAEDIIDWFKANPEKASKLPKNLQELSELKIDDNQVVIIAKLKTQ